MKDVVKRTHIPIRVTPVPDAVPMLEELTRQMEAELYDSERPDFLKLAGLLGKAYKKLEGIKGREEYPRYAKSLTEIERNAKDIEWGRKTSLDVRRKTVKVFLCHSSSDKNAARELHSRLRDDGLEPWLDEIDLEPGTEWRPAIERAVRQADVVLVCLSKSSIAKAGFVQKEIAIALDAADERPEGCIYIVPARLESCEVPERLRRWQWVDLFERGGYERLIKALMRQETDQPNLQQ